ncbi:telomere binding protein Rap1 [Schizosaccharomyces cryophilus OY26]|uniref:DNA-binding protein RAP1 n=1 Tax=Schizosaccharomyces cryophilus (strain OY26 / ATCC MYA-4695 / CBS 11777 / NBRC 106824 / NRRL Y48691) TaxID=653667 RepID=S9XJW4_SCHCR|nr:telomere binding protein Rap1 [Schizosaccharomyces cryophilus OY26]EPY53991.1 telomere binding protein Rap1 [Schizosaccharomyces cryophilus OY26]
MSALFTKDDGSSMIIAVSKLLEATPGFQLSMETYGAKILFIELREFDLKQHDFYIVPEETKKALIHRELRRVLNLKYAILKRIVKVSWLSNCIEQKTIIPVDPFRVFTSMEPQYVEQPPRRREYFSLEDEKILVDYVHKANVPKSGVNIYKELARKYPQHTAESWREHYKIIRKALPPTEDDHITSSQNRTVTIVPSQSVGRVSSGTSDPQTSITPTKAQHIHHYPFSVPHPEHSTKKRSYFPSNITASPLSSKPLSSSLSYTKTDLKLLEYYLYSYGKEKSLDDICEILNKKYSNFHTFSDWRLLYKYFYPHLNFETPAPALVQRESKTEDLSLENLDVDDQMIEEKFLDNPSFTSDTFSIQEAISPKSSKKSRLASNEISKVQTVNGLTESSDGFSTIPKSSSIPVSFQESPSRILESPSKTLFSLSNSFGKSYRNRSFSPQSSTKSTILDNAFPVGLSNTLKEGNIFVRPNEDLAIPPLGMSSDSESFPKTDSELDDDAEFEKQITTTYSSSPIKVETPKVNKNQDTIGKSSSVGSSRTSDSRSFVSRSSSPPESPSAGNLDAETSDNLLLGRNYLKKLEHKRQIHSKSPTDDHDIMIDANLSNERENSSFSSLRNTSLLVAESPNISPIKNSPIRHDKKPFSEVLRELHDYLVVVNSSSNKQKVDEAIDMILRYTRSSEQQFLDALELAEGNISAAIAKLLLRS